MPIGFALVKGLESMQLVPGAQLGSATPPSIYQGNMSANPLTNISTYHGALLPKQIYGKNATLSAQSDLWGMNVAKTFPTVAYTLAVISDSTNDAGAGTGAQTVLVQFLDANWNAHTALYTMNGQTAVTVPTQVDGIANATPQTAIRINGMEVVTAGTGLANAGNITANDSTNTYTAGVPVTAAKTFDYMFAGDNVSTPGSFSVPAGYRFVLMSCIPSFDDITTTVKYGSARWAQNVVSGGPMHQHLLGQLTSQSGTNLIEFEQFPIVEAKCDIKFSGAASAAAIMSCIATGMLWQL